MLAAGVAASAVWRGVAAACVDWPGESTLYIWLSPVALWPDWLLGAYLAERHAAGHRAFARPIIWVAGAAVVLVLGQFTGPARAVEFSAASVVAAVVLEAYLHRRGLLTRAARALAWVGVCSYSLYLIHQPLMGEYGRALTNMGISHPVGQLLLGFPAYAAAAVLAAWALYATVERGGVRVGKWVSALVRRVAGGPDRPG